MRDRCGGGEDKEILVFFRILVFSIALLFGLSSVVIGVKLVFVLMVCWVASLVEMVVVVVVVVLVAEVGGDEAIRVVVVVFIVFSEPTSRIES